MGISTLQSYRGAQIFEAIGLNKQPDRPVLHGHLPASKAWAWMCWRGRRTEARARFPPQTESETELAVAGNYQYRVRGEYHLLNPLTVPKLQHAVRTESFATFQEYTRSDRPAERDICARCAA